MSHRASVLILLFSVGCVALPGKLAAPRSQPAPAAGPSSKPAEPVASQPEPPEPSEPAAPPEPAEPAYAAVCTRGIKHVLEDYSVTVFLEDTRDSLAQRRRWLMEATRDQFVTVTEDVLKNDKVIAPKGAPYLVVACGLTPTDYSKNNKPRELAAVVALSFELVEVVLPGPSVDLAPADFVFPPAQKYKFDAALAFSLATGDDRAQMAGSQALLDKRYRCADVGIGACQDAEDRVLARAWTPDQDERKKDACWAAKKKAIAKCFPAKDEKKFDAMGRKLWTLVEAREADARAALEAKLSE